MQVELRLRKCEVLHWETLEHKSDAPKLKLPQSVASSSASQTDVLHKYPSSSHYTRDWDKLVAEVKQEEKDEKPEGDAALNKLFQQIYRDGSDDVKKAMNKSFVSQSVFRSQPVAYAMSCLSNARRICQPHTILTPI